MSACPTYICFITHGLVTGGDSLVFLAAVAAFGSDSQVCCCFVFLSCNGLPGTCGSCLCFCTPLQFSLSFSVHKNIMLISRQTAVSTFFFFFHLVFSICHSYGGSFFYSGSYLLNSGTCKGISDRTGCSHVFIIVEEKCFLSLYFPPSLASHSIAQQCLLVYQ